jgi:hypothetical protein
MKHKRHLSPQEKAYFAIRVDIRDGNAKPSDIEAFGKQYGYGADYRYLCEVTSELKSTAQAA